MTHLQETQANVIASVGDKLGVIVAALKDFGHGSLATAVGGCIGSLREHSKAIQDWKVAEGSVVREVSDDKAPATAREG